MNFKSFLNIIINNFLPKVYKFHFFFFCLSLLVKKHKIYTENSSLLESHHRLVTLQIILNQWNPTKLTPGLYFILFVFPAQLSALPYRLLKYPLSSQVTNLSITASSIRESTKRLRLIYNVASDKIWKNIFKNLGNFYGFIDYNESLGFNFWANFWTVTHLFVIKYSAKNRSLLNSARFVYGASPKSF